MLHPKTALWAFCPQSPGQRLPCKSHALCPVRALAATDFSTQTLWAASHQDLEIAHRLLPCGLLGLTLTLTLTLTLIKTEYWDRAGGGGNVKYGAA